MKLRAQQSGFTLVEVAITLSVVSIVAIVMMNFIADSISNYAYAGARSEILSETQRALDVVNNDIRLSASADINNRWQDPNAPSAPTNQLSWASGADTLVLATAAEDANGDVLFADPAKYISNKNNAIYYLSNGTLYKRTLAAPVSGNKATTSCPVASNGCPADRVILNNIQALTFKYLDGDNDEVTPTNSRSVEIYVKVSDKKYGRTVSTEYTTRTVFRND